MKLTNLFFSTLLLSAIAHKNAYASNISKADLNFLEQCPVETLDSIVSKINAQQNCWLARPRFHKQRNKQGLRAKRIKEWYENEANFKYLLEISQNLLTKFPIENNRIFAVGQTPAWIVKGAQLLNDQARQGQFGFIAFSSSFLKLIATKKQYIKCDERMPSKAAMQNYRQYLENIKMSVDDIISLWKTQDIKTVIIDGICTGGGYASFISLLATWAQELGKLEELTQALVPAILEWDCDIVGITKFQEPVTKQVFNFQIIPIPDEDIFMDLIYSFADDIEHRLVAYYPPSSWDDKPMLTNDRNTPWIVAQLTLAAAEMRNNIAMSGIINTIYRKLSLI